MTDSKSTSLNIFLIKEDVTDADAVFVDASSLDRHDIRIERAVIGDLFIKPTYPHQPRWLQLFEGRLNLGQPLLNSSSSAVLLVRQSGRIFALTFGYGRHMLEPGCWEENFGLRVTLNTVRRDEIRSIDRQSFDAISRHTRTQASRAGSIAEFGVDIEQDLLRAITGRPTDPSLGSAITGMDALKTTVTINLGGIPELLGRYLAISKEQTYKKDFEWVDNLGEVRDVTVQRQMDVALIAKLVAGDFDRLWMAVPQIIDWMDIRGFRYTASSKEELQDDLDAPSFIASLRKNTDITIDLLKKRRKVSAISQITDLVIHKWPVYHCIYCEIESGGETYLLNNGKWYRGRTDFVEAVNNDINSIPLSKLNLPSYVDAFRAGEDIPQDVIGCIPDQVGFGLDVDIVWQGDFLC